MEPPKETPLKQAHIAAGARLIDFAGWLMPVQYTGIREEHLAVRNGAGVFDISHMGQFFAEGPGARAFLDKLLTNDLGALQPGRGQYTLMPNERGGVIDDLIVYRTGEETYFLVVNASKIPEDAAWMRAHLPGDGVAFRDESDAWAGLAIQGPEAAAVFARATGGHLALPPRNLEGSVPPASFPASDGHLALPPRNGITRGDANGDPVIVCRTGYTGEDGFEFFCPADRAVSWWENFLRAGCTPCGLGARDTLRLEMGYPLNGSDLSPDRTPVEAGLGIFVKPTKGPFIGRDVLARQLEAGTDVVLAGLRVLDKAPPPRAHYPVLHDGAVVAELTSGTLSPSLNTGIAMAYLPVALAVPGTRLAIDVRGRPFAAEVVKKPFYKRPA